jgi:hypothetical protein
MLIQNEPLKNSPRLPAQRTPCPLGHHVHSIHAPCVYTVCSRSGSAPLALELDELFPTFTPPVQLATLHTAVASCRSHHHSPTSGGWDSSVCVCVGTVSYLIPSPSTPLCAVTSAVQCTPARTWRRRYRLVRKDRLFRKRC